MSIKEQQKAPRKITNRKHPEKSSNQVNQVNQGSDNYKTPSRSDGCGEGKTERRRTMPCEHTPDCRGKPTAEGEDLERKAGTRPKPKPKTCRTKKEKPQQ